MIRMDEYRKLLRVKVDRQGKDQYYFRVTNAQGYRDVTIRGDQTKLLKFLKNIKAKDTKTSPASMRNLTYIQIADGIIDGTDNEIWVWDYVWKPTILTRKIMIIEGEDQ